MGLFFGVGDGLGVGEFLGVGDGLGVGVGLGDFSGEVVFAAASAVVTPGTFFTAIKAMAFRTAKRRILRKRREVKNSLDFIWWSRFCRRRMIAKARKAMQAFF